jgi:hypothetical protein
MDVDNLGKTVNNLIILERVVNEGKLLSLIYDLVIESHGEPFLLEVVRWHWVLLVHVLLSFVAINEHRHCRTSYHNSVHPDVASRLVW